MVLPLWFQAATFAVLGALLLVDLTVVARRPHTPSLRECSLWVALYVGLAAGFAGLLGAVGDGSVSGAFVAGWLTEYSLSVDNLFVFVLIMSRFAVPRGNQQKVLMMGIIVSLVLRGACIVAGAAAVERFSGVFYVFGGFLVYTAVRLARSGPPGATGGHRADAVVRRACRVLPIAERYDGARLVTWARGRWMLTPMVIVFLAIGSADLLFALDSIPAIFGLTKDPFVVFTATLFALMGLRQLYFLLGGLLDRLVYLSVGLAVVLGFIGVKLVLDALHENDLPFVNSGQPVEALPSISIGLSLATIVVVLVVTTVASLMSSAPGRRPGEVVAPAGADQTPADHALDGRALDGRALDGRALDGRAPTAPVAADAPPSGLPGGPPRDGPARQSVTAQDAAPPPATAPGARRNPTGGVSVPTVPHEAPAVGHPGRRRVARHGARD